MMDELDLPEQYASLRRCDLCPRACNVDRYGPKRGFCGAGAEMKVARADLHMWEEPPISGSTGSGAIFFSYCSLGCVYCQNHAISEGDGRYGRPLSPNGLAKVCLDLEKRGALNINMVTPTHYAPQIRCAIKIARDSGLGLPIIWNTSGYERRKAISDNAPYVDIYLTDFKYADPSLAAELSFAPDYPKAALEALEEMVTQIGPPRFDTYLSQRRMTRGIIVRHMALPGHIEDSMKVVRSINNRFGSDVLLSLMNQYTPVLKTRCEACDPFAARMSSEHPELFDTVPQKDYERLLDYADSLGIDDYFWQDGEACKESFIPDWDCS